MKTNDALVTYTELTTMGLAPQAGVNPPVGDQCATKDFILTNYRADTATLAGYTSNRLPPYQTIIPTTVPYLACYALEITNGYTPSSCFGYTDSYESWRIVLLDQFGNTYTTPTNVTFTVRYYYQWQDDVPPYNVVEYVTENITITAGSYEGFGYYLTQSTFPCAMSSTCGPCNSQISQIGLDSAPVGVPGGCSAPPPTPPPTPFTLYAPKSFYPLSSPPYNTFKIYKVVSGVYTELDYASYPNATWEFIDASNNVWYHNYTGGVYAPWNNYLENNTSSTFNTNNTIYYVFNLNDGSGRKLGPTFVTVLS